MNGLQMIQLMAWWYDWGALLAALLSIGAAAWVYLDSQQSAGGPDPTTWRMLTIGGAVLVLPSLFLKFGNPLELVAGVLTGMGNVPLFFYLGFAGLVAALIGAIGYYTRRDQVGPGVEDETVTYRPSLPSTDMRTDPVTPITPAPLSKRLDPTRVIDDSVPVMGTLLVARGNQKGRHYKLGAGKNTVGRDGAGCNIVLDDDSVSKQHAQINYENGQFRLYDLASRNHTYVNGELLTRNGQMLLDDDEIKVGDTVFVFKTPRRRS
ncbi:MAG: FHA domain-containing protein [Chloroflexi bacterium]|nr:FHA domain-containing protein [Chloroflexota bacterium]